MSLKYSISVIIPFYNSSLHIKNCIDNLINQDFDEPFEIIMINDGSKDNSLKKLKKFQNNLEIKLLTNKSNYGPAFARNLGIKEAKGEYLFFLDVDDKIEKNTLSYLFNFTKHRKFDLVFCDRKWIENSKNLRKNKYCYHSRKIFQLNDIKKEMKEKFYNPLYSVGLFQLTGRLIKRSVIQKNKILFEEKLRYLEDEAFEWDIVGSIKNALYLRKQLYSYYFNNNLNTALSVGISKNYDVNNFDIVKNHIKKALIKKKFKAKEVLEISNQGYIFLIISALISISRSIKLGKIKYKTGISKRTNLIKKIFQNKNLNKYLNFYKISKNESVDIVQNLKSKSLRLLSKACDERAQKIIKIRRAK